jgi:predicted small metal-binding protein
LQHIDKFLNDTPSLDDDMLALLCRETGLDCDYIIKGETEEEILKNGAEHVIQVHDMKIEDIYLNTIPANFLCQTIPKLEAPIED